MELLKITGAFIVLLGSFFLFTASLGLIRMPDYLNRIQAGTKASTLGSLLVLIGIGAIHPHWIPKLFIIFVFILITNPVSSHVIGRAGYFSKSGTEVSKRDDLLNFKQKNQGE